MLTAGPLLCSLLTALQVTTVTAGGDGGAVPDIQYNGRVFDPGTGFHDYGARLYWPEIGRFISVDAAGPNFADPMTLNRYAYVLNNPYKYVDPTGHFSVMPSIWGKEGGPLQWFAKWFCTEMAKQSLDERLPWIDRAQAAVAGTIVSLFDAEAVEKTAAAFGTMGSLKVIGGEIAGGNIGRTGAQARLREIAEDVNTSAADRGWIKQEINSIERGQRSTIRNPPGKQLAHTRGREAAKGYDHVDSPSNLQDTSLHKAQHKFDDFGRANTERP